MRKVLTLLLCLIIVITFMPTAGYASNYIWPLPGYSNISSQYGWRTHPISGERKHHNGIDIPAPSGTPVKATNSGTVVAYHNECKGSHNKNQCTCKSKDMGNYVKIKHDDGMYSIYMHLSSVSVTSGRVSQGQKIGGVGTTGASTGNHLHFGITNSSGSYVNPSDYVNPDNTSPPTPEEPETPKTPEKPILRSMNSNYWSKENITFSWNSTTNTTHYNLYITKYNGSSYAYYENVFYAESGLTKQLSPGNYRILLQATNSNYYTDDGSNWLYTDGDYVYFTVFDKPEKPVLKNMNSNYWSKENITFSWNSTDNTTHYNLYITKHNGSSYAYYENVFYAESGLTKQLSPGNYRIQLQSTNSNYWENSEWLHTEGEYVYITVFDKPEKPVLTNIKDIYNKRDNIVFSWETSETATHYNIYFDTLIDGEYTRTKTIHYAESGLTEAFEPGKYRVLLQATNSNYWENSTWLYTEGDWVYFTIFDKPDKPELTYLKNSYKSGEEIVLTWETSETATHYNIYFDILKNGKYERISRTTHYAESGLTEAFEPGKYRVLLQATNSNYWENSDWLYTDGDWMYFTIFDKPDKPELTYLKNSYKSGEEIVFTWETSETATHYNIYFDMLKNGKYERISRTTHYAESGLTEAFEPGKYRVLLQATNSNYWENSNWLYTDGDWKYFSVCEKDIPYTSSTVIKNRNNTELYNFTAPYEILIVAYKGNQFVTIESVPHNEQNSPYTLEGDIDKIKVMVWSDLSTLKPLCEAEVITSDEFIIEQ